MANGIAWTNSKGIHVSVDLGEHTMTARVQKTTLYPHFVEREERTGKPALVASNGTIIVPTEHVEAIAAHQSQLDARKAAEQAARDAAKADRQARAALLPREYVLAQSGSYLLDEALAVVRTALPEEADGFREDVQPRLRMLVEAVKIKIADSPLAEAIARDHDRPAYLYAYGESRLTPLSDAEYQQIRAECREAKQRSDAQRHAAQESAARERAEIFARALETGQPQVIRRWSEECDGSIGECSLDNVTELALPDGSTTTRRVHTH